MHQRDYVKFSLTIVMPAYNEEGCVETVVREWEEVVLDKILSSRLVVVNDGSKDKTGEILNKLALDKKNITVIHQQNAGHGVALRKAYDSSLDSDWIFQVDSDNQFSPQDFWTLWDRRGESNFILGYRKKRFDAVHRLVITRVLRLLLFMLFGFYCRDSNIPFRLIKGKALRGYLALVPKDVFTPNIFLTVVAIKSGQKPLEIPVSHRERGTGKVSIMHLKLLKALLRSFRELMAFRKTLNRNMKSVASGRNI